MCAVVEQLVPVYNLVGRSKPIPCVVINRWKTVAPPDQGKVERNENLDHYIFVTPFGPPNSNE